jgi:hypothetical protein
MTQRLNITNAIELLSPTDRDYCQAAFDRYWSLVQIQFDAQLYCTIKIDDLRSMDRATGKPTFIQGMQAMEKWYRQLICSSRELTKTFIQSMEAYFRDTYQIKFRSILETDQEMDSLTQLPGYAIIVYNILRQAGPQYFAHFLN